MEDLNEKNNIFFHRGGGGGSQVEEISIVWVIHFLYELFTTISLQGYVSSELCSFIGYIAI